MDYLLLSLGAKKAAERNAFEIEMCNLKDGIRVVMLIDIKLRQYIIIQWNKS
jgi:hypothetical protein